QFTLGETASSLTKNQEEYFILTTNKGTQIKAKVVVIAAGLGCFEPRKPHLVNLSKFEDRGVDYIIKDPEKYRDKNIVIAGGGDSALDWTIFLADVCQSVHLIHRRTEFRGAPESVKRLKDLVKLGTVNLLINSEVKELIGEEHLKEVTIQQDNQEDIIIPTDYFIPLFGLTPKLGPIAEWGLGLDKNAIVVDSYDYATNVQGIFAIGDINTYSGKLKLILCGFHEATLMVQSAFKLIHGGKNPSFKYTTVTGIKPLD
ncbi:MAG: NAD(P)/FAD-dependent oxidoreductase, partial [Saprospiraceae bacterium]